MQPYYFGVKTQRIPTILLVALIGGLTFRLLNLAGDYPFYAYWDMDQVTAVDLLLLNSGYMPDHIHHPGGAMYLVQNLLVTLYHQLDWLSIRRLTDLSVATNPVGAMAELIDQLRQWSAWICLGTTLWLWLATISIRRLPPWLRYSLLLALVSASYTSYHASLIRTDTYAAFFWAMAVLLAIRAGHHDGNRRWWLFAAHGLALGLAMFAKLQVLLLLPIPYLLSQLAGAAPMSQTRRTPLLLCLSLVAMLLPLPGVIPLPILEQGGAFLYGATFGPNPIVIATLAGLVSTLLGYIVIGKLRGYCSDLGHTLFGFVAAPWLVALVAPDWSSRRDYFLHLYKIVFWRPFPVQDFQLGVDLLLVDWPITIFVAITLTAYLQSQRKANSTTRGKRLTSPAVLAGMAVTLVFLQVVLGSRPIVRDMIWLETAGLASSIILLVLTWSGISPGMRRLTLLALFAVIVGNLYQSFGMPGQIAAVYNHYTYDSSRILFPVLNGNNARYSQTILQRIQSSPATATPPLPRALIKPILQEPARTAVLQAIHHRFQRRLVSEVLPGSAIDWLSIGSSAVGMPVWAGDSARYAQVPPLLEAAISVDLTEPGKQTRRAYRLDRDVNEAESLSYYTWQQTRAVTVIPRNDYSTFLFLEESDYLALIKKPVAQAFGPINIDVAGRAQNYYGYFVDRVIAVPVNQLPHKAFLLLVATAQMRGSMASASR